MSGRLPAAALAGLLVAPALFWFFSRPQGLAPQDLPAHRPDPVNGEVMFHAGGCASCHGPGLGGGLELETPFGLFRVPNISPDDAAGIGRWSELDFVNALARGVSPGGRHYYPSFPWTSYARMRVEDIVDLKAYIDTLSPVDSGVAAHELGFPWNIRRGIGLWKRLYFDPAPVVAVDADDPLALRGRYLAEGPGHCAECHTPRGWFGGLQTSRWLAGGDKPEGEGRVPNITPHADGLASWSERDIVWYLETGFTPDFDIVGGSMVKVQENLALLEPADRAALAAYLKAVPARPSER